jgi:ABC-type transport system involved in multi-copper enzyme maturation permease subunit
VGVGMGLVAARLGVNYGAVDSATVQAFIGDYLAQMFITLASTAIAASYAAFAATITHSVTSSAMIAIAINIAETGILVPAFILYGLFKIELFGIYLYTPSYNLANISTYVTTDHGYLLDFSNEEAETVILHGPHALEVSILIVALIMILFVSLTVWRFQRQDITV